MALKVRADAWPLARMIIDAGGSLETLPPDTDGWHSGESITRGLVAQLWPRQAAATAPPWGSEDPVTWARRTGRVTATSEPRWRADLARDEAGIGAVLASLAPVAAETPVAMPPGFAALAGTPGSATAQYNAAAAAAIAAVPMPSTTPVLDQLQEQVYGPSRAKVHAMQDSAAERELTAQLQREAEEAATAPSDADIAPLFRPSASDGAGA